VRWAGALDALLTLLLTLGVMLVFEAEVAAPFGVPSASMEPTIHCARPTDGCLASSGDRIMACRLCYRLRDPHHGEIVVFHAPPAAVTACGEGGVYLKRLIGLPGDTVREDGPGHIWVDGRRLDERYVEPAARRADTEHRGETWVVPEGQYLMVGDNRGGSCDSRTWGFVPRSSLIGPVVATYWPPVRIGF
jgi:signal peptidase I